jgi:hydroxypyruvate isomerase
LPRIKQAAAWWCVARSDYAPEETLHMLADIGYEAVEMVPQELWPQVKSHGLSIASVGGHASLTNGLNRRENHARIERELQTSIKLAEEWHIPNLIVFSGNRDGLDDKAGLEATAEGLQRVAHMAEEAGVTLVLELLNSKVDHPDYQCDHSAWGVEVCRLVDSPRVKLLYDIYHMQIMEGDIIRTIRANAPYIGHYHTAGNPGRHEIDETQELYYPPIVRAILETGYIGYLGQEFKPLGDHKEAFRRAFEICDIRLEA